MKLQKTSNLGADFGFVAVLAAMLAIGASAWVNGDEHGIGARVAPAPDVTPHVATEVVNVVPYRIEVIGVRTNETAHGDMPELRSADGRSG